MDNLSVYFIDYYTAWTNGISTTCLIDDRSFSIGRKLYSLKFPEYIVWLGKNQNYQYDGRYKDVDHIIVRGKLPARAVQYMNNFISVEQRGSWELYSNKKHISSLLLAP